MRKKSNDISNHQFRQIYANYYQQKGSIEELPDLIRKNIKVIDTLSGVPPWSYFYDLPYITFIAIHILAFDLTEAVRSIANETDQVKAFLDYVDNMPDTPNECRNPSIRRVKNIRIAPVLEMDTG